MMAIAAVAAVATLGQGAEWAQAETGKADPAVAQGAQSPMLQQAAALDDDIEALRAEGKYAAALPLAAQSLSIREQALGSDHVDVADALARLAKLHNAMGEYDRAIEGQRRALSIRERVLGRKHPQVALSLNGLANTYSDQGQYDTAQQLYERALSILEHAKGQQHPDVAGLLNNLGNLHARKGEFGKAKPLFARSLSIRERSLGPEHPLVAQSLNSLGNIHVDLGLHEIAAEFYRRSLAVCEKSMAPDHPRVAHVLNNLANLHVDLGQYDQAAPLFARALDIWEAAMGAEHHLVATALNNLASVYWSQKQYERAQPLYERSLGISKRVLGPIHPEVADTLNNLANLDWAQGALDRAIAHFRANYEAREAHFALVMAGDSMAAKRQFLAQTTHEFDALLSFALATADRRAGRLAFTAMARRKGRVLDSMSNALTVLRNRMSAEDAAHLDAYRKNRAEYASVLLGDAEPLPPERHRALLAELASRGQELEQTISQRSLAFRQWAQAVTLEQIQAEIPPRAVLIEWLQYQPAEHKARSGNTQQGPMHYAAAILRHEGDPVWLKLGPASELDKLISKFRHALAGRAADVMEAAQAVDAAVMMPIRAQLPADIEQLFLAPDGAINLIPFAALTDTQGRYLLTRYDLGYLTSGRDLVRIKSASGPRSPGAIMVNPSYDASGAENVRNFTSLDGTAEEGRAVKDRFPSARLFMEASASTHALSQLQGPAFLHIATHGYFDSLPCGDAAPEDENHLDENPMLKSGLAMAGANACHLRNEDSAEHTTETPIAEDGLMTALELAALDLHGTQLAVLSACDTGLGATEIREQAGWITGRSQGVYGLRRALVLAGAETQLVSLWRVSDVATRDLMTAYYAYLAQGKGRGPALRQVQLDMMQSPERGHPHYWASFILSGDTGPMDPKLVPKLVSDPGTRQSSSCNWACTVNGEPASHRWPQTLIFCLIVFGYALRRPLPKSS